MDTSALKNARREHKKRVKLRYQSTEDTNKKVARKQRPSTAKKTNAKRKIANQNVSSPNEYLLNIDPSNQEIVAVQ